MIAKKTKVFKESKWIWHFTIDADLVNSWMQARKNFDLDKIPDKAEIALTADAQYKLYVNGKYICRGPARGFQQSWPFDRIDIAPFLRKGKNVICALVHNPGVGSFQYIHKFWAGFILEGKIGGSDISTGKEWLVRSAPGYIRVPWRYSPQLGMQEFFDAGKDDFESWLSVDYDDSAWIPPSVSGIYPSYLEPWPDFEERGIEMLKEDVFTAPQRLLSTAAGICADEYYLHLNSVSLYCREERDWRTSVLPLRQVGKWGELEINKTASGSFVSYCLDFGEEVAGAVSFSVEDASGGEIIDYLAVERVIPESSNVPFVVSPEKTRSGTGMGNRLILRKGKFDYEMFAYWGLRYLVITARDVPDSFKLRVSLRKIGYPLTGFDNFACSDKKLNKIYDICSRSVQCCSFDAIVDCPWREQAQWLGDTIPTSQSILYMSGDTKLFRRALCQGGRQVLDNGLTYGVYPSIGWNLVLPDYTLQWISSFYSYYWISGDLSLFRAMSPQIIKTLSYYEKQTATCGLLPYDQRYWLYLDIFPLHREGYSTFYNLLYFGALTTTAMLFTLAGDERSSIRYLDLKENLKKAILSKLYNREKETFYGGLDWKQQPVEPDDPHSYAMAIIHDLVPERNALFAKRLLEKCAKFEPEAYKMPRFIAMYYIFEALKKTGYYREVIDQIFRFWYEGIVVKGLTTTPEGWNNHMNHSACHGWGSHPIKHLANILGGVWQRAPAWEKVLFKPLLTDIEWGQCKVPTPFGIIESSWCRKNGGVVEINFQVPEKIEAVIDLPDLKQKVSGPFSKKLKIKKGFKK